MSCQVVFTILGVGALILTVNIALLGGTIVFFQSLCLLGYCLFPLDVASIVSVISPNLVSINFKLLELNEEKFTLPQLTRVYFAFCHMCLISIPEFYMQYCACHAVPIVINLRVLQFSRWFPLVA